MKFLLAIRYVAFVGNTLAWIIGMGTLAILAYLAHYQSAFLIFKNFVVMMGVAGSLIYLTGFFGCCGSVRINKTTMDVFLVLGILTLLLLVSFLITLLVTAKNFTDGTTWNDLTPNQIKIIQEELDCCGFSNLTANIFDKSQPLSCFKREVTENGTLLLKAHRASCQEILQNTMAVIEIGFSCIIGLGITAVTIGMVTIGKLDTQLRRQHKQDELSYQAEQEEQNAIEGKNKY